MIESLEIGNVVGEKGVKVVGGVGIFKSLTFSAKPGSKNVTYKIYSSSINTNLVKLAF